MTGIQHARTDSAHCLQPVTVVVVTYNSADVVSGALEELHGRPGIEIVVWDNNSSDRTADLLEARYPDAHVVRGAENLGFAKAVNRAAELGGEGPVLLLNPDARLKASELERMAQALAAETDIAIVAPKVEQPEGRLRILDLGNAPTVWRMLMHWTGISRWSGRFHAFEGVYLRDGGPMQRREVDWVTGACMLIRREAWNSVGGLSERWFMYAEDVDLCLRLKRQGWRVVYEPEIHATHDIGGSSSPSAGSEPQRVRSDWIINLYDMYCRTMAPNGLSRFVWKWTAVLGLLSRSVAFRAKAWGLATASAIDWSHESSKFVTYARDLIDAPIARRDAK